MVYHRISLESLKFSQCTHTQGTQGDCVYQENTSDKWDIPWYNTIHLMYDPEGNS